MGIRDRAGPFEFWMARGIEYSPIWTDTAFEYFPGLIDRLNDVVIDAVGLGARDEVSQHHRLVDASRVCVLEIIAGARPAEFRNDDTLAGIRLAKLVIDQHGLIDRLSLRESLPVGQDVCRNVVDSRNQFRMLDPNVPDLTCRDWDVGRALHALDHLDEIGNLLLAAKDGFVADDDDFAIDVRLGEFVSRVVFSSI